MVMTVMMMVLLKIVAEVIVQKAGLPKRRAGAVKTIKRVAVPMTVTWQLPKAVDSMVYFLQIFVVNSLAFSEFPWEENIEVITCKTKWMTTGAMPREPIAVSKRRKVVQVGKCAGGRLVGSLAF